MFGRILAMLGNVAAATGSQACGFWVIDEPKMPKKLVK